MSDSKQNNESLTILQLCFPGANLAAFAFCSGEIKKSLFKLDPYGCGGPNGIFPLSNIETADYLAPKIATVFHKVIRGGGFSVRWES